MAYDGFDNINPSPQQASTSTIVSPLQEHVKCAQFKTSPLVANQLFIIFILKSIKNDD